MYIYIYIRISNTMYPNYEHAHECPIFSVLFFRHFFSKRPGLFAQFCADFIHLLGAQPSLGDPVMETSHEVL